jgi:anaerobic magnesium-protoporphyrin IX monomethyl ester cyclase
MSRVLLGHSYFLRFDPKLWQAMQPYPPLGTLYAASVLRRAGYKVVLFDAMLADSTAGWQRILTEQRPDFAVLFEDNFNYLSKMCLLRMREAALEMIDMARRQGCPVVVCGADATDNSSLYLKRGASYALLGEGEDTLIDLLQALRRGGSAAEVAGLEYLDADGSVVSTGRRPVIRELDELPPPARDLIDLESYRRAWQRHGRFSLNLVTSRGCPFHCNWCAKPIWGQRYAVRGPEAVVEEIRELRDLGARHLWFMDDILGLKPGWLPRFADAIEDAGLQTPFKCLSRADLLLRPNEVEALRRAGCQTVWLGAESGSQAVLDAMEKGTTVGQVREAARRLKEAGIEVAFFLQFGYPGETWDDIQQTLQLVRDCDPDDIGVSVSYPLPGTPFYERVRDRIMGRHNWVDSSDLAMLYDGPYPTAFYHHLHSRLHAEFRIQKASHGRRRAGALLALLREGRLKRAASLLRDMAMLPLLEARLELTRRRSNPDASPLPTALSRHEAATPSPQDEAVRSGR